MSCSLECLKIPGCDGFSLEVSLFKGVKLFQFTEVVDIPGLCPEHLGAIYLNTEIALNQPKLHQNVKLNHINN